MCDTPSPATARPRWWILYVIPGLATAALVAIERAVPTPPVRTLLEGVLIVVAFGAMAWWVRANRTALDLADWCACAPRTVGIRVIEPDETLPPSEVISPSPRPGPPQEEPAPPVTVPA